MEGIIVDEIKLLINNNKIYLNSFKESFSKCRQLSVMVKKSTTGEDLEFLSKDLFSEMENMKVAIQKIENLQKILSDLIRAYKLQEEEIIRHIHHTSI